MKYLVDNGQESIVIKTEQIKRELKMGMMPEEQIFSDGDYENKCIFLTDSHKSNWKI